MLSLCALSLLKELFALQETARFRKAKKIFMPAQFSASQKRAMAMRNARGARFLVCQSKPLA